MTIYAKKLFIGHVNTMICDMFKVKNIVRIEE